MPRMPIGVDLAKSAFEVALAPVPGQVRARQRLSRPAFTTFFAAQPPAEVQLEACGSAHHWGRELQRLGHHVTLLHPRHVARYRNGNKTDRADAKALLEAARTAALSRVPVKSGEQQAVVALHRLRQGHLRTRTARINALRGHLREFGVVIPVGVRHVLPRAHAARTTLPPWPSPTNAPASAGACGATSGPSTGATRARGGTTPTSCTRIMTMATGQTGGGTRR